MDKAELLIARFESIADGMDRNAENIITTATAQGVAVSLFDVTLDSLRAGAEQARAAAQALRDGDAVAL